MVHISGIAQTAIYKSPEQLAIERQASEAAQRAFNNATQAGVKRSQSDFPNLPGTAADCLAGRHWELVPTAKCVCDGDPTRTPVSNDNPSACVPSSSEQSQTLACSPPYVGSGIQQARTLNYMGVPPRLISTGPWNTYSVDCEAPPAPPVTPPPVTPPPGGGSCSAIAVDTCSGTTYVVTNSCTGEVWQSVPNHAACLGTPLPPVTPPPVTPPCWNGAPNYPTCTWPVVDQCPNGASNYPTCTFPPAGPVITYGTDTQTLTCLPPSVGASTQQTRTITYTNGVPTAYGSWTGPSPQCFYTSGTWVLTDYRTFPRYSSCGGHDQTIPAKLAMVGSACTSLGSTTGTGPGCADPYTNEFTILTLTCQ